MGGVAVVAGEALPKSHIDVMDLRCTLLARAVGAFFAFSPMDFEKVEAARAEALDLLRQLTTLGTATWLSQVLPCSLSARYVCDHIHLLCQH